MSRSCLAVLAAASVALTSGCASNATTAATTRDPLIITDATLAAHLATDRVGRLDHQLSLNGALLSAPKSEPLVSADQAFAATEVNRAVSGFFETSATFEVSLASYRNGSAVGDAASTLVYDFEVNGAICFPNSATTAAPPGSRPTVPCAVYVLVDADTGALVLDAQMWG